MTENEARGWVAITLAIGFVAITLVGIIGLILADRQITTQGAEIISTVWAVLAGGLVGWLARGMVDSNGKRLPPPPPDQPPLS